VEGEMKKWRRSSAAHQIKVGLTCGSAHFPAQQIIFCDLQNVFARRLKLD
jgi:hypothetical protein